MPWGAPVHERAGIHPDQQSDGIDPRSDYPLNGTQLVQEPLMVSGVVA